MSSETYLQLSIFIDALLWQLNDTFVAPSSKRLRKHLDLSWVAGGVWFWVSERHAAEMWHHYKGPLWMGKCGLIMYR